MPSSRQTGTRSFSHPRVNRLHSLACARAAHQGGRCDGSESGQAACREGMIRLAPCAPSCSRSGPLVRAEGHARGSISGFMPRHARPSSAAPWVSNGAAPRALRRPRAAAAHISTSVMGWIACARRTSAGATSDSPRYFTLPSSTIACAAALLHQARPTSVAQCQQPHMLPQGMRRAWTAQKLTRHFCHGPSALAGHGMAGSRLCSGEPPVPARLHALHDLLERRVGLRAVRAEDEDVDVVGLESQIMRGQDGQSRVKTVC